MNTINLGELVKGLMVVIGIAVSMGRLPELKRWAAQEAFGRTPQHLTQKQSRRSEKLGGKSLKKTRDSHGMSHI